MARPYRIILSPILMATRLLFGVGAPYIRPAIEQRSRLKLVRDLKVVNPRLTPVDRRSLIRGGNAPLHHLKVARNRCNTPTSGSQRGTNRPRTRRDRQGMHVLRTR